MPVVQNPETTDSAQPASMSQVEQSVAVWSETEPCGVITGVTYGCTLPDPNVDSGTCRYSSHVAIQQELGLLPNRRPGSHPGDHHCSAVSQPHLKSMTRARLG